MFKEDNQKGWIRAEEMKGFKEWLGLKHSKHNWKDHKTFKCGETSSRLSTQQNMSSREEAWGSTDLFQRIKF